MIENVRKLIFNLLATGNEVKIPRIVFYELERGLLASNASKKLKTFLDFSYALGVVEMTEHTFSLAARIYASLKQQGQLIEDDDIFIGASALENSATLITDNARHFNRIENMQIEVWVSSTVLRSSFFCRGVSSSI